MDKRTVLITGCSEGGIGSALAECFHRRGFHVFATARSMEKMSHLSNLPNTTLLPLDVTSTSSVAAAFDAVKTKTGGTLNVLVNNAGIVYTMPILDVDIAHAQKVFDVNVWGNLRAVQAFAPLLIAAKGCIASVTSLNAVLWPPFIGIYGASKAAQELLSETLRLELEPFGVRVLAFTTGGVVSHAVENQPDAHLSAGSRYVEMRNDILAMSRGEKSGARMETDAYAEKVVGDILAGYTGKSWRGAGASIVQWALSYLPTWYIDRKLKEETGINRLQIL